MNERRINSIENFSIMKFPIINLHFNWGQNHRTDHICTTVGYCCWFSDFLMLLFFGLASENVRLMDEQWPGQAPGMSPNGERSSAAKLFSVFGIGHWEMSSSQTESLHSMWNALRQERTREICKLWLLCYETGRGCRSDSFFSDNSNFIFRHRRQVRLKRKLWVKTRPKVLNDILNLSFGQEWWNASVWHLSGR